MTLQQIYETIDAANMVDRTLNCGYIKRPTEKRAFSEMFQQHQLELEEGKIEANPVDELAFQKLIDTLLEKACS
jgi:hypothetical protein